VVKELIDIVEEFSPCLQGSGCGEDGFKVMGS